MATNCPVREVEVCENWKCASLKNLEAPKPEEPKWWGKMMSPGGDVDPIISKVTWLMNITWDGMETWDVCHVLVIFEHLEY